MDALAGLLDGPRARGAFLLRALLDPPWCLRIQDEAPLTLMTLVRGTAVVAPDGGLPVPLAPGDVAIARGSAPYLVADDAGTPPQVVIHPGQHCRTPDGEDLATAMSLGVRTWGHAGGATVMLIGTYEHRSEVSDRLLDALPALVVLRADTFDTPALAWLAAEIVKDDIGQQAVLDRLLDLLLITALRTWFDRADADPPGWYRALGDPVVGPALRDIQRDPAEPWTVASLAAVAGVSRAAFARRFTELVGDPPMTFLTGWRMSVAADLLLDPDATVTSVARQVGYGTPFAFSTAFKRAHGVSPQQHRAERRAAG